MKNKILKILYTFFFNDIIRNIDIEKSQFGEYTELDEKYYVSIDYHVATWFGFIFGIKVKKTATNMLRRLAWREDMNYDEMKSHDDYQTSCLPFVIYVNGIQVHTDETFSLYTLESQINNLASEQKLSQLRNKIF